jgi:hypothetical protein
MTHWGSPFAEKQKTKPLTLKVNVKSRFGDTIPSDNYLAELVRVVGFRGEVAQQAGYYIIKVSEGWLMPIDKKLEYLKEWLPAKVKKAFVVTSVEVAKAIKR